MSVTLEFEQTRTGIAQIVSDVFQTMLGLEVTPMDEYVSEPSGGFTATVQFLGESKGIVLLRCNAEQAKAFAFRMLGEEPPEINDDVRDVLGELANIVGGNLKSLFSPGLALSLPLVAEDHDYALHLCDSNGGTTVSFSSEVGIFNVSLVHIVEGDSELG